MDLFDLDNNKVWSSFVLCMFMCMYATLTLKYLSNQYIVCNSVNVTQTNVKKRYILLARNVVLK